MINKNKILFFILILLAAGAFVAYYLYNKPVETVQEKASTETITAKDLYLAFDANEQEAMKKYQDKVIVVKGVVDTLMLNQNGGINILLSTEGEMGSVNCELDQSVKQLTQTFKKGDSAYIKGICSGKLIDVIVNRCIIK